MEIKSYDCDEWREFQESKRVRCMRCRYSWIPYSSHLEVYTPKHCPACKNKKWNKSYGRMKTPKGLRGKSCNQCGRKSGLTTDHIIPKSKGGTEDQSNIQILCLPCNASKSDLVEWPGRRYWSIKQRTWLIRKRTPK